MNILNIQSECLYDDEGKRKNTVQKKKHIKYITYELIE